MTIGTFILKNALRNKRRATLSVLSVAVSLFLLTTLLVALRELTTPPEGEGAALRVIVRSKVSIANALPARQRPIIERIPGVEAVSPFSWFGGQFKNEENTTFGQFAVDPKTFKKIFVEGKISPEAYQLFESDRQACIIGQIAADKYKFKPGDRISLTSTIYPVTLEFKIAGIYSGSVDDRNMFFNDKYLNESVGDLGEVGTWWIKVRSADDMPHVISAINHAFENTADEVRAESERAFQLSFISMMGNIKLFIGSICTVVVFTLILVAASTMSMAIRERAREIAILKALGFNGLDVFGLIAAESFALAMTGGLIGCFGTKFLFSHVDIYKLSHGNVPLFPVSADTVALGLVVAAVLGLASSLVPAYTSYKMSVVEGLQELD